MSNYFLEFCDFIPIFLFLCDSECIYIISLCNLQIFEGSFQLIRAKIQVIQSKTQGNKETIERSLGKVNGECWIPTGIKHILGLLTHFRGGVLVSCYARSLKLTMMTRITQCFWCHMWTVEHIPGTDPVWMISSCITDRNFQLEETIKLAILTLPLLLLKTYWKNFQNNVSPKYTTITVTPRIKYKRQIIFFIAQRKFILIHFL